VLMLLLLPDDHNHKVALGVWSALLMAEKKCSTWLALLAKAASTSLICNWIWTTSLLEGHLH